MNNPKSCPGQGCCLRQADCIGGYERIIECSHNCQPMKCPNYVVCGEIYPSHFDGCWGKTCMYCDQGFGKILTFKTEKQECFVCLEEMEIFVQMPNCTHFLCIACFRHIHHPVMNPEFGSKYNIMFKEPELIGDYVKSPISKNIYEHEDDNEEDNEEDDDNEEDQIDPFLGHCPMCRAETIRIGDREC